MFIGVNKILKDNCKEIGIYLILSYSSRQNDTKYEGFLQCYFVYFVTFFIFLLFWTSYDIRLKYETPKTAWNFWVIEWYWFPFR